MSLLIGRRPAWVRILLVPSQDFVETLRLAPDGDTDLTNDFQVTDPVTLRFETPSSVAKEFVVLGQPQPDGSVTFALSALEVNKLINDAGSATRRVRVSIGSLTWGTGYFEIDGEW